MNYSKHSNETYLTTCSMLLLITKRKKRKGEDWTFKRKKTNDYGLFSV